MTNYEIFTAQRECNKWLSSLTEIETNLIMLMMDDAREYGYDLGAKENQNNS